MFVSVANLIILHIFKRARMNGLNITMRGSQLLFFYKSHACVRGDMMNLIQKGEKKEKKKRPEAFGIIILLSCIEITRSISNCNYLNKHGSLKKMTTEYKIGIIYVQLDFKFIFWGRVGRFEADDED